MLAFLGDTSRSGLVYSISRSASLAFFASLAVTGCAAGYQERSDYLLQMAQRGVEVNKLFRGQDQEISEDLCLSANSALNDDIPSNRSWGYDPTSEWEELVRETFVNACISGEY
ncbi:hypothetical protein ABZ617_11285 [Nocardiopsis alba]|uniref:hypothetical protein n=1 Tax=Nocardiopsis alba TaxID=53437 RepID=UPI0033C9BE40